MRVTLTDGSQTRSFQFVEPSAEKWSKQNCEFLKGLPTGLAAPFDRVFVKRVEGSRVVGHELLTKLVGRTLPASPTFFGYTKAQKETHLYFFQYLDFKTLEEQLNNVTVICPEIVNGIVRGAADVFQVVGSFGYIYMDFCAKNIMLDRKSNRICLIDIDSSWPSSLLRSKKPKAQGQIEFWGLWNERLSKVLPVRLENAQKSVLLSFAAVWARAVALKRRGTKRDFHSALTLVHSPSLDHQRPLWEALAAQSREGVLEYFGLRGARGAAVYAQWQALFNALLRGRDLPWQEIVSATENVLVAIGETDTCAGKVGGKRFSAPAGRRFKKERLSRLGMIAEAEAADIQALISRRR